MNCSATTLYLASFQPGETKEVSLNMARMTNVGSYEDFFATVESTGAATCVRMNWSEFVADTSNPVN